LPCKPEKPKAVLYAERALWAWTAWICLFGVYQTSASIPDIEQAITTQLQGTVTITPQTLMAVTVVGYAALALTMIWIVLKIGAGKRWARSSLLLGFILDALYTLSPPHHGILGYLTDVPDLGLQIYTLVMLYTAPGSGWFNRTKPTPAGA
jgi:peptidoglycan/LPS O-acetylase OafA/YrhL